MGIFFFYGNQRHNAGINLAYVLIIDSDFSSGYALDDRDQIPTGPPKRSLSPQGRTPQSEEKALAALKNMNIDFDEDTFRRKVQDGDAAAVKLFLDAGMPAVVYGKPAIATAVEWGHTEVTQVLIDAGSDVNVRDDYDQSLVMQAASSGKLAVLEVLIAAGADVNVPNMYKVTPLAAAAEQGKIEIVQALIKAGAKVNARNTYGGTALQVAVLRGYKDVVKLLIASGADVARDRKELIEIARKEKHRDIEKLIRQAPAKPKKK